ncbi:amidohydrolase, partial [Rhizobium leguminosarum]
SVVVSVTKFNSGFAHNVIPNDATFAGTVRTLDPDVRTLAETRFRQIIECLVAAHGAEAVQHVGEILAAHHRVDLGV